ncbi:MAG: transposase [Chromatiales bacterium]|nr:transposase [Chromatiales bacterium]
MPRPRRLNLANVPQHVIQRGNNRQACFFNEIDHRLYLKLLDSSCQLHQCQLHAYVLMTNHVHLLMTPLKPDGVSLVLRDLGRDYVRTINKVHQRSGTLWEGRFRSSLVDATSYCLNCYRYIEMNPVRAGMVTLPGEYPWSSFRTNALGRPDRRITPHLSWMRLGENSKQRQQTYKALVEEAMDQPTIETIRRAVRKGLPTGNKMFQAEIEQALGIKLGSRRRGRPGKIG